MAAYTLIIDDSSQVVIDVATSGDAMLAAVARLPEAHTIAIAAGDDDLSLEWLGSMELDDAGAVKWTAAE